ncbi:NAD(P)H-dependent flavin oxidoreductase [Halomonas elongata]|uniref:NAD(P)H-dependent flavin oxidoreductase n=1 Tax=Halomonas elongata TaxID=2746 RepID=UPI0038D3A07D
MVDLSPVLRTPLLDDLGCEVPILLAGMGGVSRHQLALAVARAGGFGVLGMVREPVERIRTEVSAFQAQWSGQFGVNLIPAATERALLKAQVEACLSLRVPTMVLFWEVDQALVRHLKSEGIQVIHQVGSRHDADRALAAGVDMLIVQGHEAGGHVRGTTGTFTLLSQLAAECSVPLVASGGIGSGQALVAALALGAQGVSLGTAMLATHEANAHRHHKQRVVQAVADETCYTTCFTRNWPEPAPVRVLRNAVVSGLHDDMIMDDVIGEQDGQPVYRFSTDSPLADATGQVDDMALYCGQSCGQLNDLCSTEERIRQMLDEAHVCLERLESG